MAGIFHLAIPCRDVDEAACFYESAIGARVARRYGDRVTLDFFGHQVVCHLAPEKIDPEPELYPRHFGFTFTDRERYEHFRSLLAERQVPFFRAPFSRFQGRTEEHETFFLKDPSNNLLEFKYYYDASMIY